MIASARDASLPWAHGTLLTRLRHEDRQAMLRLGTRQTVGSGERLLQQGDNESHVLLLLEGIVKVTVVTADGHEAMLDIRVAGDVVGEMSALNGQPRSATVTTCGPAIVSVIQRPQFCAFLRDHPDGALALAGVVADRLRLANEFRVDFATCHVRARVARVLLKIAASYGTRTPAGLTVNTELTQTEFASFCGAAEPSVHKVLREFRESALIKTGYRQLTIINAAGLRAVAGLPPECPESTIRA